VSANGVPCAIYVFTPRTRIPAVSQGSLDLASAIATVTSKHKVYDEARSPPALPTAYRRWVAERAPDAPHDPNAYFPMVLYK
jgi:hypothetical protein